MYMLKDKIHQRERWEFIKDFALSYLEILWWDHLKSKTEIYQVPIITSKAIVFFIIL